MDKVRVGMIGLGGVGSWGHLRGYEEIPEQAKLVAFCDINPAVISEVAKKHGAKMYSDYNQIVADPNIDIIDICLPHFLHGPVALAAAKAGRNVLCEKPFTTTVEAAEAVIAAARDQNVKLMVAENTRFVKAYEVAKKFVERKAIGDICFARTYIGGSEMATLAKPDNWVGKRALSGGLILDAGVHSMYLLRWMVGDIKGVHANIWTLRKDLYQDIEDNAMGVLRFSNDTFANFTLSNTTESPWTERLELYGTKGSLIVDMLNEHPLQIFSTIDRSNNTSDWWDRYGNVSWEEPFFTHSAMDWKAASMRKEVQHYVQCVLENKRPLVTGEEGRKDVQIALCAYESAKLGREVEIPV